MTLEQTRNNPKYAYRHITKYVIELIEIESIDEETVYFFDTSVICNEVSRKNNSLWNCKITDLEKNIDTFSKIFLNSRFIPRENIEEYNRKCS